MRAKRFCISQARKMMVIHAIVSIASSNPCEPSGESTLYLSLSASDPIFASGESK
jgi:hypothetical protein